MRTGTNAITIRDANRQAVLERIRLDAPVTRAEIARDTGLTPAAVSNIVGQFLSEGLVVELGRRARERGQPPVELDLADDGAYSLGLHLDRDLLSGVVVDLKGRSLASVANELAPPSPDRAVELLSELGRELVDRAGIAGDRLLGAGVVTVGPLDIERGTIRGPPNFPGWQDVPLRDLLQQELSMPVLLENNATAAAIGEHWYGAGRGLANFLYVYIGLGVGGGLFFANRIYRGSGLNAGEFGYLPVHNGSEIVPLEDLTSLRALREELGGGYDTPGAVARAYRRGDERLLAWLDRAGDFLAAAVAGVDNLLDLDAVIIGGRHDSLVLEHLVRLVGERSRVHVMPNRPHRAVVVAGRTGDDTAALGAATLPLYRAFSAQLTSADPASDRGSL